MGAQAIGKAIANYFKTQPVRKVWLFSFYARGEETPIGDVDILVQFDEGDICLLKHSAMICEQEEILYCHVDIVQEKSVHELEKGLIKIRNRFMREYISDRNRLEHIVEAIDCILDFADGKTKEELESDKLKYYGIIKNIEIIGEAVSKLTRAFCRQHPETLWMFTAKLRHELVRHYYQIDSTEIYKVIDEDLPTLREQVNRYLSDTDWDEWEKSEIAIVETATHNSLVQTATRMKQRGYNTNEICKITELSKDEIEAL